MRRKNSPGCKCCKRVCTADVDHICICSCLDPYLRAASIGDDLGTHTMNFGSLPNNPGPGSVGWATATLKKPGVELYNANQGNCVSNGVGDLQYDYMLSPNCTTGEWSLWIRFKVASCREVPGVPPFVTKYGTGSLFGTNLVVGGTAAIDIDCDNTSMLNFTLPSTAFGLAVPGGGGAVSVVF